MKVVVDTQSGSSFFIDVEFWDTALEIKQKIEKSQGIPLFKQTLFFQGKVLQDHLLYFEFQDSRLHLSISPDDNPNQKNNDHMPQTEQSPSAPSNPSHEFVNIQDWPVMSYNDQVPQTEESPSTPSNPIHEFVNNQDLPVMSNNDQVPETEESPMTLESKKEFFGIQDSPEGRNNQVLHQTEQSPLPSNSFGETVTIHKITHGQDSYVELALKNSQRNEKTLTGGAQNGDDFSVDDLLDFYDDVFVEDETELKVERKRGVSDENTLHWSNDFSTGDFPTSELSVPMDDLAELEWLSNFVEDSFTPYSAAPTKKPVWLTGNRRHPAPPVNEDPCFKAPPPSSSSGSSSPLWLADSEFLDEPMAKRQKQEKVSRNAGQTQTQTQTQTRRCSHCGVQKTPQWREGPAGAKTLCNACGLRYKSGRLLPEYRPTYSPTFSSELHSNRHRKVIEMRRNKGDLRRR